MNDGVDAGEVDLVRVANVALDDGKVRVRLELVSEPLSIECDDLMALPQQLGHEDAALVAAGPSHEHLHLGSPPENSRTARP